MEVWTTAGVLNFVIQWGLHAPPSGPWWGFLLASISYFYTLVLSFEASLWWTEIFWATYFFSMGSWPSLVGSPPGSREDMFRYGFLVAAFLSTLPLSGLFGLPWILWHLWLLR